MKTILSFLSYIFIVGVFAFTSKLMASDCVDNDGRQNGQNIYVGVPGSSECDYEELVRQGSVSASYLHHLGYFLVRKAFIFGPYQPHYIYTKNQDFLNANTASVTSIPSNHVNEKIKKHLKFVLSNPSVFFDTPNPVKMSFSDYYKDIGLHMDLIQTYIEETLSDMEDSKKSSDYLSKLNPLVYLVENITNLWAYDIFHSVSRQDAFKELQTIVLNKILENSLIRNSETANETSIIMLTETETSQIARHFLKLHISCIAEYIENETGECIRTAIHKLFDDAARFVKSASDISPDILAAMIVRLQNAIQDESFQIIGNISAELLYRQNDREENDYVSFAKTKATKFQTLINRESQKWVKSYEGFESNHEFEKKYERKSIEGDTRSVVAAYFEDSKPTEAIKEFLKKIIIDSTLYTEKEIEDHILTPIRNLSDEGIHIDEDLRESIYKSFSDLTVEPFSLLDHYTERKVFELALIVGIPKDFESQFYDFLLKHIIFEVLSTDFYFDDNDPKNDVRLRRRQIKWLTGPVYKSFLDDEPRDWYWNTLIEHVKNIILGAGTFDPILVPKKFYLLEIFCKDFHIDENTDERPTAGLSIDFCLTNLSNLATDYQSWVDATYRPTDEILDFFNLKRKFNEFEREISVKEFKVSAPTSGRGTRVEEKEFVEANSD